MFPQAGLHRAGLGLIRAVLPESPLNRPEMGSLPPLCRTISMAHPRICSLERQLVFFSDLTQMTLPHTS